MYQKRKTTISTVIEYFKKSEIEITEEEAKLVLEHIKDIAMLALNEYFGTLDNLNKQSADYE